MRSNRALRMSLRRFTQSTNGHNKNLSHRTAVQSLLLGCYNFAQKNEALKHQMPVMASRLSDHVWTIKELIERAA